MTPKSDKLPGVFDKQVELYVKPGSPGELSERAKLLEGHGLVVDAIDYYAIAKDTDALLRLRALAVEEGDLFNYLAICRSIGESPDPQSLESLARAARTAGKDTYADAAEKILAGSGRTEQPLP